MHRLTPFRRHERPFAGHIGRTVVAGPLSLTPRVPAPSRAGSSHTPARPAAHTASAHRSLRRANPACRRTSPSVPL